MLAPEYLNSFSSGYLGMCDVLNEQIIRDVARRIAKTGRITPTAEWQLKQAKQSGALMNDVIREVGVLTGKSDTEILRLFQDAGLTGMLQDAKPLLQAGKLKTSDIVLSGAMQRTMEAAAEKCKRDRKPYADNGNSHTAGVYASTERSLYEGYVRCFFVPGGNQTGYPGCGSQRNIGHV